MRIRTAQLCGWLFASLAIAGGAHAQTAAPATVSYNADYFDSFSPHTALDMVERVPGFVIDEGEGRRGFSGAQSNVLIDGEPPASKAQEIDDLLARIPASDVLRIELIRGAGSSAGTAHAARVNVVRRSRSGDGVWELGLARADDGELTPSGEVAWSGRRGNIEYGLSADFDLAHLPIEGVRADYDGGGALAERRDERVPTDEREGRIAGEATFPLAGGDSSLNGQLGRIELDEDELASVFTGAGDPEGFSDTRLFEREDFAEIGATYRRTLGDWRTELTAVATRRRFESEEASLERDALAGFDEGARQTQRVDSGETILRVSAQRNLATNWTLELGAEAALNTLEQRLALTEDDGSGPVPVILPSANVEVEEERGEAWFMLSGTPSPRWTLEAGAAVEGSLLTQSGDANRETELTYWKPSIQFVRSVGERDQVRVRAYRDVGQLDFEDFVSAADISDAVVDAGNPDLRPETSWRLELAGDWRFGEDGAFNVTLYRWWVEDALDIVPVGPPGDQLDAPGNIGDADVIGARAALSLPLPLNSELRLELMTQNAEATDPLTGEVRSISGSDEGALVVGFRQDATHFAWGADFEREREAPSWRLDRIEQEQDADEFRLWIETTAFADLKLRVWASNLTESEEARDRRFFDPDRLGILDGYDARARGEGVTIGVSASGRF